MNNYEEIDLKKVLEILFSKQVIVISTLILLVSAIIGYTYSYKYKKPLYESSVTILLVADENKKDQELTQTDVTLNSGLISTYSSIVKSNNIISKTIENLELNMSVKDLQNCIEATQVNKTQFLQITVKNTDATLAKDIANELAEVFTIQVKEIYNLQNTNIVDYAEIESHPCNVNHAKDIVIFMCGGLLLIIILVMGIYLLDDTIKNDSDIERKIQLRKLGTLPIDKDNKKLIIESNPKSNIVESIKALRTNILYSTNRKTILITSCKPKEGKSWVVRNLAVALAQANKRVILVDADLRKKSNICDIFNIEEGEGVSDFIREISNNKLENLEKSREYIKETQIPNLHVLQNGTIPPNPSELITSKKMKQLLDLLKDMYDIILLDGTSCMIVADSIALSSMVDNTILISECGKTKITDIKRVKKSIEDVKGKIAGIIINKVELQKGKYYGKKYGYYYGKEDEETEKIETTQSIVKLEDIIQLAKMNIQDEMMNQQQEDIISEDIISIEENGNTIGNIQIIDEIKGIKTQILKEMRNLKNYLFTFRKDNKYNEKFDNIVNEINNLKEMQSVNNKKILEKIDNKNYDEQFAQVKEQISNKNYDEQFAQVKEQISNKNYDEQFAQVKEQISNKNYDEQFAQVKEQISNKNIEILIENFMMQIEKMNNEIQNLKEMQINSNSEIINIVKDIDYKEEISQINEKIKNMKYEEEINEKIEQKTEESFENKQNVNNIISFESLRQKRLLNKRVFKTKDDISFEDLERLSLCIMDLNDNNFKDMVISK